MFKKKYFSLNLVLIIYFLITSSSYAYLDPVTGSFIIQIIVATFAAIITFLSFFWSKTKEFFYNLFFKRENLAKSLRGYVKFLKLKKNDDLIFYSESKNYRNYFIELINNLGKSHKIIYLTSDEEDLDHINDVKPIFIGDGIIRLILFKFLKCKIIFLTLTNLNYHQLKKSKKCENYIYIFHSLVSTHKCYEKNSFEAYDIIFSNGPYQTRELKKAEEIYNFKQKKIFETGYLYYEFLKKNKKNLPVKKGTILFAPSWNRNNKNLFDDYSHELISSLLKQNFKVIFRPHPELLKRSNKTLKKLVTSFKDNNNFRLNKDITDFQYLEESEFLITDNGGMALEYSTIFEKPTMYINYSEKIHNKDFKEIDVSTIEDTFKEMFCLSIKIDQIDEIQFLKKKMDSNFIEQKDKIKLFVSENFNFDIPPSKKCKSLIEDIIK